jgi:choline kinase
MHAIMLAAGMGIRLTGGDDSISPKALLMFGGKTLLERHLEVLRAAGVESLTIVVGYHRDEIEAEIARLGAGDYVSTIHNPDYRYGSLVSLWHARHVLASGRDVLFMDADVLYDPQLVTRLVRKAPNRILLDRDFEPGDEPVKLCLVNGAPVEFRKKVERSYDTVGEWPGFLAFSAETANKVAAELQDFVDRGLRQEPYEEAFRAVMLADPRSFAIEDITGVPWIEIDFPADIVRAERQILPRLAKATASSAHAQGKRARG